MEGIQNFGKQHVVRHPLGGPRRKWDDNIRLDLWEIGCKDERWMELAEDCVQCGA
jgi:hypothetical protein